MECALCKKDRPLRKSHIFPEWLYETLYDESHKFTVLSTSLKKRKGTRPTGIYDRLFCDDCEGRLSMWEKYAKNVFHSSTLKVIENERKIVIYEIQYSSFKLFQMSLLWRASITSRPELHRIDLGPHGEEIRKMLFEDCPGEPYEYGSILLLPPLDQEIMKQFIYPPEQLPTRLDSHRAYRAVFGGLFWVFIISSHAERLSKKGLFISKDGQLPIFKTGFSAIKFIKQLAVDFQRAGMFDVSV